MNIEQSLISIIVPVYNVESFLCRCVNSLLEQSYENIEIILIDDGSTDSSGEICDEIAEKDSRVKVIHKENGGLSDARNKGLEIASGSYIGFVDSDDWVSADMYECLFGLISDNNADAAQINFIFAYNQDIQLQPGGKKTEVYEGKEILQYFMTSSTVTGKYSVWLCLFKKSLLDGLMFRKGKVNEDIDYKYKALSRCKKFVVSNQIKYFYFMNSASITRAGLKKRDFDLYDAAEELYKLTQNEDYGSIKFLGEVKRARTAFSLLCKIAYYGISDPTIDRKQITKELTNEHRKNLVVLLKSPMKFNRKVVAVLLALNIKTVEVPLKIAKFFHVV